MRVIGRTKPRGEMKVKGGRPGVFGPRSALSGADPRPLLPSSFPYQSEVIPKGVCGVSPFPPHYLWLRGFLARTTVRLLHGSRLYAGGRRPGTCHSTPSRKSVVGLAGFAWALGWCSARQAGFGWGVRLLARVRPVRSCLPILLCPEWPSARAVGKYHEQTCWDPKDGELCLARMKPEETLVEVRSNSDVQIDCQSWV